MTQATQAMTAQTGRQIARPLKVLIPLIQGELQMGNSAARDHYRRVGDMLVEAKEQVPYGSWGRWLSKNFDLSDRQARVWMQWSREHSRAHEQSKIGGQPAELPRSLHEMTGGTERRREERQSKQQQEFRKVLRDVAREEFVQERQTKDDEIKLHRELAEELVDLGYRALATRLHPDRGGSKDAMTRLNRVREELRQFAKTRRFI